MQIAVASGKGGTGKTTVATNLARIASRGGQSVAYVDCDVEEPNGALFLKPRIDTITPVYVSVPSVDPTRCNGCGLCGDICQFSAITVLKGKVLVFPDLCHGCGGCWLVCPAGAITESFRRTGQVETGTADGLHFIQGVLDVGEATGPPVIRAAKVAAPEVELLIIDSPPGTSCPVVESIRGADFVLLVTEPTPFGLNDLKLAVDMVRTLRLPFGVIINRADGGDDETAAWSAREGIQVIGSIPEDRCIAEAYSRGELICDALPACHALFQDLLARVAARAGAMAHVPHNGGARTPQLEKRTQ